jgi:hypothetical protein
MFKKNKKDNIKSRQAPKISRNLARKFLSPVPEPNVFWCSDGNVFRDIQELKDGLTQMSDQTFLYHCNAEKKDFGKWIREVVGDEKLAESLDGAPDRENAVRILEERCTLLLSKAG